MAQPSVHGRFIWQELMTDDTAGAAEFYAKVVGWQVQAPTHPNGDYRVFATGRRPVGGVMSLPDYAREAGARAHWLPYIGADDVDGLVARIEPLGGKVLRAASDVPDVGRYAVLADPQGAAFGVYRPERSPAASAARSAPGEFAWQELATTDFEAAFHFYSGLFGWQSLQRMDMGPAGTYLIFGRDGVRQGGIYKLSAQMPAPYWLSYISVADVDAAAAQARELSARIINGPMDVPDGGRIAQLLDRSGVLFAIHANVGGSQRREGTASKRPAKRTSRAAGELSAKPKPPEPQASVAPARKVAGKAARKAAKKAAKKAAGKSAGKSSAKSAGKSAGRPAKTTPRKTARKTGRKVAGKAAGKTAGKTARKATKTPRKTARKAAPRRGARAAGKTGRRTAKKVARTAGKRAAGKAAGRRGAVRGSRRR